MIGAQMDNWDVVFTVMVAILVASGAMLLHLAVSHRHKDD